MEIVHIAFVVITESILFANARLNNVDVLLLLSFSLQILSSFFILVYLKNCAKTGRNKNAKFTHVETFMLMSRQI